MRGSNHKISNMKLNIYRKEILFVSVEIDTKTAFSNVGMGEHQIKASFIVPESIELMRGDYIIHRGIKFKINEGPESKKANGVFYNDIIFEAPEYDLYDKKLKHEKAVEFSYFGTPREHLALVINNILEIKTEPWEIGEVDEAEPKKLDYKDHSCRTAVTYIAQEFGMEYSFDGYAINLKKTVGRDTTLVFEIGRGKGLYEIQRSKVSDKPVYTRVTGYGGEKNISSDYRSGMKKLMFEDNGREYIDRNTDVYGIIEGSYINADIYPRRTGIVSACSPEGTANQSWWIEDKDLPFDLNDQLIEGVVAKLTFTSGDLAGNEIPFEITKYDLGSKRIYFNATDDNGYILPNAIRKPAIGHKYIITDIRMPKEYLDEAEEKLKAETIEFAEKNCLWQFAYPVKPDPYYLKELRTELRVFDRVRIKDKDYHIDDMIRIVSLSYPLVDEYNVTFTVSETIPYTPAERTLIQQAETSHKVKVMSKQQADEARFWAAQFNKMKGLVFDPDGKIQNAFVEAMAACFGSESQNFALSGVTVNANFVGDMTKLYISAGDLVHYTYKIAGLPSPNYIWRMEKAVVFSDLDVSKDYYVYAKCSKTALTGEWAVSNVPMMSNAIDGYYCFNLGILFQVNEGETYRGFDFTKGNTLICGDQITAGLIQSLAKNFIINLTEGSMYIKQGDSVIDIGYSQAGKIKLKGVTIVSGSGAEDVIGCDRGEYNTTYVYYEGDTVTYQGSTYKYISKMEAAGHLPTDANYWRVVARRGDDGKDGSDGNDGRNGGYVEYRYAKNGSTVTPPELNQSEQNPEGWSDVMPVVNGAEYLWMISAKKTGEGVLSGSWSKPVRANGVDGRDGMDGVPGKRGEDGMTYYTWIRYADDSTGKGISNEPLGKMYIGFAYKKTTSTESNNPADYQWTRFHGEDGTDGIPGERGKDGVTYYTWLAYSDNADGSGMYQIPTDTTKYIGIAVNKETASESNNPRDYVWSKFKGEDGRDGSDGKPGPGIVNMGDYSPSKSYYGNEKAVVVVKYSGQYYISRVDAGSFTGIAPTNTSKWNPFGAQFESIATGLLLADNANLAGLIFKDQALISQKGLINGVESNDYTNPNFVPHIRIDGKNGKIILNGFFASRFSDSFNTTVDGYPSTMNYIVKEGTYLNFALPNDDVYIGSILTIYLDRDIEKEVAKIGASGGGYVSYKGETVSLWCRYKGTMVRLMATKKVYGKIYWELINFNANNFAILDLAGGSMIVDRSKRPSEKSFETYPPLYEYWSKL